MEELAFFISPITKKLETMPVAMVNAYLPYGSDLHLEEAARVAAIRDQEEATNLLLSIDPEALGETTVQALTLAR